MGTKISELQEYETSNDDDILAIVDTENSATKKITKGNLLKEVNENIEETNTSLEKLTTITVEHITIEADTTISNGYEITLTNRYTVGNNSLEVYWNGVLLQKYDTTIGDGHYVEVGDDGEESNTIKMYRTDDDGDYTLTEDVYLIIVIRGVS